MASASGRLRCQPHWAVMAGMIDDSLLSDFAVGRKAFGPARTPGWAIPTVPGRFAGFQRPGTVRQVDRAPRASGRFAPRCDVDDAGQYWDDRRAVRRHWRPSPYLRPTTGKSRIAHPFRHWADGRIDRG